MRHGSPDQPTDRELLETAKRGPGGVEGRAAFDLFITRHRTFAVNLARGYMGDRELAEDLAQEGFLRLYRMLPRYEPTGSPRGLLARLIRNVCLTHLGRDRRARRLGAQHRCGPAPASLDVMIQKDSGTVEPAADPHRPESDVEDNEAAARVADAVDSLSPLQQEVVRLRYSRDLSYKEIAAALETTVNNVGVLLHQALRRMRELLRGKD